VSVLLHQFRSEQKLYWRSRELAFFTFIFPLIIFVLLGSVYGDDPIEEEGGVTGSEYLLAGLLGYGVAATAFAGLAILVVIRRESGVLKRLRGTPLPAWAWVVGTLGSTVVVYFVEAVALIALGKLMFDVPFPEQPVSVVLGLLLGALAFAALGVALTTLIRSAEGASAVISAIYLPMAFLAGSFWTTEAYPPVLEAIAGVLPLTYFIDLMRDIVLHNEQVWENWTDVGVVAAWGLVGLVVTVLRFRWEPQEG
jgi:ABC-2 type transport system permease protein